MKRGQNDIRLYVGGAFGNIGAIPQKSAACLFGSGVVGVGDFEPSSDPRIQLGVSPNPSRGETQLEYALPAPGWVRIVILDLQGRVVARLGDGWRPAGRYSSIWSGRGDDGSTRPGLFFASLQVAHERQTKPFVVLR